MNICHSSRRWCGLNLGKGVTEKKRDDGLTTAISAATLALKPVNYTAKATLFLASSSSKNTRKQTGLDGLQNWTGWGCDTSSRASTITAWRWCWPGPLWRHLRLLCCDWDTRHASVRVRHTICSWSWQFAQTMSSCLYSWRILSSLFLWTWRRHLWPMMAKSHQKP